MQKKGSRTGAVPAQPQHILVPVDFSPASDRALRRAAYVGALAGARIHILHVLAQQARSVDRKKAERGLARAGALLRAAAREAGGAVAIVSRLSAGKPHVQIIRHAREIGAELVIVGRAGASKGLGRTARRIVHMNDVATLLVGRRASRRYRRPLVAVETDPCARHLIELTCRVVGDSNVPVRVVHAYNTPFEHLHTLAGDHSISDYARLARVSAERELTRMLAGLKSTRCEVKGVVRRGDPTGVIAREAARWSADLVGVGTHGRSGVAYALLGSIAEWVVENTTRDVLVSRPVRFTFVAP